MFRKARFSHVFLMILCFSSWSAQLQAVTGEQWMINEESLLYSQAAGIQEGISELEMEIQGHIDDGVPASVFVGVSATLDNKEAIVLGILALTVAPGPDEAKATAYIWKALGPIPLQNIAIWNYYFNTAASGYSALRGGLPTLSYTVFHEEIEELAEEHWNSWAPPEY